jgi:hypothetical protein
VFLIILGRNAVFNGREIWLNEEKVREEMETRTSY